MSQEPVETVAAEDNILGHDEIKNNLLVYGEDVLLTKIPHFADGCKNIIRRILWFNRTADVLRPMNKMVGDLQDVHTSGDSSIADAILRLGQWFNVGHPLIEISGKSGEYYDVDAAAATRYLDTRLSDFAADVFFRRVNTDAFVMIPTKNSNTYEPKYMVPKIPMALVMGNLTVGMAFKSQIPMMDFTNICSLVMLHAKYYQNGNIGIPPAKSTAKYFLPGFPIRNIVLNRKDLLASYSAGKYDTPILLEGWVDVNGTSITLRTMPYGNNFGKVVNEFRHLLKDPKNRFRNTVDSANNYSSNETEFTINLKFGKNPFAVLDELRGVLKLSGTFYPLYNYVRNGRIANLTPPLLTYFWYKEREYNIVSGLNHKLSSLNANLMRIAAILQVIDYREEVIKIITESEDDDATVEALFHHFQKIKLTRRQADIIARQPLRVFNKSSKQKLLNEMEQTNRDIDKALHEFSMIHETIGNDAEYLKKRYTSSSQTLFSDDYIGHVQFGNWGLINFFNFDEMKSILATKGWPSKLTRTVTLYDKRKPYHQIIKGGKVIDLPYLNKEICCERLVSYPADITRGMTLVVTDSGKTSVIKRLVSREPEGFSLFPITSEFYAIHKTGKITKEHYKNFTIRESVSGGARTDIIYALPAHTKDVVIFHMNTEDANNLRVSRILYSEQHRDLKFVPCGETKIVGVYPLTQDNIILNIPNECVKGIKLTHIFITKLSTLFAAKNKDYFTINLSRGRSDLGVKLKQDSVVNTLFHLDFSNMDS